MFRAIGYLDFPGPMALGSTLSRGLAALGTTNEVIYNCTLCRLCETTCPENAPVAELVRFIRQYIFEYTPELAPEPLRELCTVVRKKGSIFDEPAPENVYEKDSAEYVLFLGCHSRHRQKQRAEAAVSILKRLAVDFTTIDEVCCGAPLSAAGCAHSSELALINMERIREKNTAKVITLCPHCLVAFLEDKNYAGRIEAIHIAELLSHVNVPAGPSKTVTYHDPCMLGRVCGVFDQPRQALEWAGAKLVEMDTAREMAFCCGNWGGLMQSAPDTAGAIAAHRLEDARNAGAEVLLTECPWCLEIFKTTPLPGGGKPRIRSVVEYLLNPEG